VDGIWKHRFAFSRPSGYCIDSGSAGLRPVGLLAQRRSEDTPTHKYSRPPLSAVPKWDIRRVHVTARREEIVVFSEGQDLLYPGDDRRFLTDSATCCHRRRRNTWRG